MCCLQAQHWPGSGQAAKPSRLENDVPASSCTSAITAAGNWSSSSSRHGHQLVEHQQQSGAIFTDMGTCSWPVSEAATSPFWPSTQMAQSEPLQSTTTQRALLMYCVAMPPVTVGETGSSKATSALQRLISLQGKHTIARGSTQSRISGTKTTTFLCTGGTCLRRVRGASPRQSAAPSDHRAIALTLSIAVRLGTPPQPADHPLRDRDTSGLAAVGHAADEFCKNVVAGGRYI